MRLLIYKLPLPLLLVSLTVVTCSVNANENDLKTKQIHAQLNRSSRNGTFNSFVNASFTNCLKSCSGIIKCHSISYNLEAHYCELSHLDISSDALETLTASSFTPKYNWKYGIPGKCVQCSENEMCSVDKSGIWSCRVYGCLYPSSVQHAKVFGNRFNVGAKRLYTCRNGQKEISVCQPNGSWSSITINCTIQCNQLVIENANVSIIKLSRNRTKATVACHEGYFLQKLDKVYCDVALQQWDNLDKVGCIKIFVDPWTKVFRLLGGTKKGRLHKMWTENTDMDAGNFRNNDVLSNWDIKDIKLVKIEVTGLSDEIVARLIFDGAGTDIENWFSVETLFNSTWSDLSNQSSIQTFSIKGVTLPTVGFLRWAILNNSVVNNTVANCTSDLMWFAAFKHIFYPCDVASVSGSKLDGLVIVYSTAQTGTTWDGGNLSLAKDMTVSVLLGNNT